MERAAGFFVQRIVLLRLSVETDVERDESVDPAGLDLLPASPFAEGYNQLSELGSPVSEMVDADAAVAAEGVNFLKRVADYGRPEMSDMERFGAVRRRVLNYNSLAFPFVFCSCLRVAYKRSAMFFAPAPDIFAATSTPSSDSLTTCSAASPPGFIFSIPPSSSCPYTGSAGSTLLQHGSSACSRAHTVYTSLHMPASYAH